MSDQIIRYGTEEEYIEYTNHRRYLATGDRVFFPDWEKHKEAYWDAYHDYMRDYPDAVLEMWTILHKENIDSVTGTLHSQECTYDTLAYKNIEEGRASRKRVRDKERPDPGVPVSIEFKTTAEAERMRALLMQGELGYYYDIKHRAAVAVVNREKDNDR